MSDALKDLLVGGDHMSEEDFQSALEKSQADKVSLMHAIELLRLVEEDALLAIFCKHYGVVAAPLADKDIPREIIELIPKDLAQKYRVLPIDRAGNNIIVAMGDPRNLDAIDAIRFNVGFFPKAVLASEVRLVKH